MNIRRMLLMIASVSLLACGSGASSGLAVGNQLSQNPSGVAITNFTFQPATITVAAGSTVTWTNQDSIAHTTTSDAPGWDSNNLNTGQTFAIQFNTPGTYTYHCNVHPGMKATVVVQ